MWGGAEFSAVKAGVSKVDRSVGRQANAGRRRVHIGYRCRVFRRSTRRRSVPRPVYDHNKATKAQLLNE